MIKKMFLAILLFMLSMFIYTKQLETYYLNQQYALISKVGDVELILSEVSEADIEKGKELVNLTPYKDLIDETLSASFSFEYVPYFLSLVTICVTLIVLFKYHEIKTKQDFMYQIELIINRHYQIKDNSNTLNIKLNELNKKFQILEEENQHTKDRMRAFIEDVAHQIKSPLTSLKLYVDLEENQKMEIQVQRIETIVTQLIHLGRLEAHAVKFHFEKNDLKQIINESLAHLEDLIIQKEVVINNQAKSIDVFCDSFWLQETFVNLLDNSIEYSHEKGNIIIDTKLMDEQVLIEINDEGIGISQKDAEHLFDRFYTNNKQRKETTHMGIGLNISKEVVLSHHGHIYAIPKQQGMSFIIKLPLILGKEKL